MADVIRAELVEIIKRIELPYAEPAFGSKENTLNIKKALLSGYFMQVSRGRPRCGPRLGRAIRNRARRMIIVNFKTKTLTLLAIQCSDLIPSREGRAKPECVNLSKRTKDLLLQRASWEDTLFG